MPADEKQVRIGTSGWNYSHWRGPFYPEDCPQNGWFEHYASEFDTVEINNTFYNLPEVSTFEAWRKACPEGFLYVLKGNRYITHMKKLKDPEEPVERFLSRARKLEEHLGPVLWQLPPNWHRNAERLRQFIGVLPDDIEHVFEFRDEDWFADEIMEVLEQGGAGFCTHDMGGIEVPRRAIGALAYVRFHGMDGKYRGRYTDEAIEDWADWLADQHEQGRSIYAYFNNDAEGHAPRDAIRLRTALRDRL